MNRSKNNLSKELRTSLEFLKERRAALITAAVTGRITVEEMAAQVGIWVDRVDKVDGVDLVDKVDKERAL